MIKKLLLPLSIIFSASFLGAVDTAKVDDVLSDVKPLSEEQMQSITGEDITIVTIFPISNRPRSVQVTPNAHFDGMVIINGDTGEVIEYLGDFLN